MSARKYWLGFNQVAGVGPRRLRALLDHFGSLEAAWHADLQTLREIGLDRRTRDNLLDARRRLDLNALVRELDELGATALTWDDLDYPPVLKELPDAPPVLYARGSLTTEDNWAVAIVGTRKASAYGRDTAYELAGGLAAAGVTVISGLALGIDAAAHKGALDAGGRTIGVLPCGIDVVYPPEHRKLAQAISEQGALVTPFAPSTQAEAKNFPPRNWIMSGLSLGVIVVEASEKSGALITAGQAGEQGREVFAVPGRTTAAASKGTNRLIQDGAKLVMEIDDVLAELNLTRGTTQTRAEVQRVAPANEAERLILAQIGEDAIHVDDIARASGLPIATVTSTLALMELKGLVRQIGNMQYRLPGGAHAPFTLD